MPSQSERPSPFTAAERDLIRSKLGQHFGQYPSLADGLFLRIWRSGPQKGEPKLPPAVPTMLERGVVEIRPARTGPRAYFTAVGLNALRELAADRRALDPARFPHLRAELGLEKSPDDTAAEND